MRENERERERGGKRERERENERESVTKGHSEKERVKNEIAGEINKVRKLKESGEDKVVEETELILKWNEGKM